VTTPASRFDKDSTTTQVLEGIDLAGVVAVVTGGSGGLGEETSRALAACGASVVMTARDLAKGEAAAEKIRASTGNPSVEVEELELDSLASVRAFAKRFLAQRGPIQLLINNAGVMASPKGQTQDGFERQFGTNHVGHFLLTCLLAPALRAGTPARVVNLSSGGHRFSDILWDDPQFEHTEYEKFRSYGQSKTANVLFTVELDRRLRDEGVRAFAVHPGAIVTELGRHLVPDDIKMMSQRAGGKLEFKTIPAGAATSCYAATSADLEGLGGLYLEDCHVAERNDDETSVGGVRSYAVDADSAQRLWALTEELVGESFDLA
jgi:NAD(P)-dependent dehydrogenase (short-subunit alcohol dehydrogenase family)